MTRIFTDDERFRMERKPSHLSTELPCLRMSAERAVYLMREHGILIAEPGERDADAIERDRYETEAAGGKPAIEILIARPDSLAIYAVNTEGAAYARYAAVLSEDAEAAIWEILNEDADTAAAEDADARLLRYAR